MLNERLVFFGKRVYFELFWRFCACLGASWITPALPLRIYVKNAFLDRKGHWEINKCRPGGVLFSAKAFKILHGKNLWPIFVEPKGLWQAGWFFQSTKN